MGKHFSYRKPKELTTSDSFSWSFSATKRMDRDSEKITDDSGATTGRGGVESELAMEEL